MWLAGALWAIGALLVSIGRVGHLARRAGEIVDPDWCDAAASMGGRLGLRTAVRLVASDRVRTPMAGGLLRPTVFLPTAARSWTAEQRDLVLAHELAHLAVRDPLRLLGTRLAVACYWFHPLVWVAARQSAIAREQACDEAVLALGARPSAYARVLLDLAASMHGSAPAAFGALPIVEPSLLETRLMAILAHDRRPLGRRRFLLPAAGAALFTISIAAAQPTVLTRPSIGGEPMIAGAPVEPVGSVSALDRLSSRPTTAPLAQAAAGSDACDRDLRDSGSFSGSMSTGTVGGRTVVYEQVGRRGGDRVIQRRFGDLRVCMVAEGIGDADGGPSQWVARASHLVMETRRGGAFQQLEIDRTSGAARTTWRIGSTAHPLDAAAERWRDRLLAVLDTTWDLSTLRGQVSSLRGDISSVRGEESSLRGEISSLRGEVSSMRGRASSIRGEESSLRGEISAIRGHASALRGQISSERGSMSSLTAGRYDADADERKVIAAALARHEAAIERIEREIRDYDAEAKIAAVDERIKALNPDGKVAEVDDQIRRFDVETKVAAIDKQIAELDVAGKVAAIERRISALDADRRGRELENQLDGQLKQLETALGGVR